MREKQLLWNTIDALGHLEKEPEKEKTVELREGLREVARYLQAVIDIEAKKFMKLAGECGSD